MAERFAPKTIEQDPGIAQLWGGDMMFDAPRFTLAHIENLKEACVKAGFDPEKMEFHFHQRFDLCGDPFELSVIVPR